MDEFKPCTEEEINQLSKEEIIAQHNKLKSAVDALEENNNKLKKQVEKQQKIYEKRLKEVERLQIEKEELQKKKDKLERIVAAKKELGLI